MGNVAELHIDSKFPRTTVFVLFDQDTVALRWSYRFFISLFTVKHVKLLQIGEPSWTQTTSRRPPGPSH
eukprot:2628855-Prymnesium_polylepis.1